MGKNLKLNFLSKEKKSPNKASIEEKKISQQLGIQSERYWYKSLSDIEKLTLAIKNVFSFDQKLRPINCHSEPGGLVEFPEDDKREIFVIGDIHGNKKNLKAILQHDKNLYKLRNNEAVIVFLGDIVHDERSGHLTEMESSIEIMDIVIDLINRYPQNVVYLLGNHESLDPQLAKNGIRQGTLYHEALIQHKSEGYAELIARLFASLPLFVKHRYFLAMHAGPVRGGIGRSELINIHSYPDCIKQLTWNRLNETHSTPNQKEYAPEDLDHLRKTLHCSPKIPIFVGHNPMWKWGGEDSIWIDILHCHDHVILYSGASKKCPYISVKNSYDYQVKYANLKLKERRFVMDNYE